MKLVKRLFKVLLAGVVAVCILSVLLSVYYNLPLHIENPNGNTDYVWPSNAKWVKMTEGYSMGKYDAQGFNNKEVVDNPNILILGSSHMEATNVMQDENTGYLLGQLLEGRYTVYNMGISGHDFYKVCQYLPNNLSYYERVPEVVVIETNIVSIESEDVRKVLDGTVAHTPSYSTGIIVALQKVPFFRLLYSQISGGLLDLFMQDGSNSFGTEKGSQEEDGNKDTERVDLEAYDKLFGYISNLQEKYGTKIVIFYHPMEILNRDGTISFGGKEGVEAFSEASEKYGITFVDMGEHFEKMYYEEHHVAHGFSTGLLGSGHLNRYGHAAVAEALMETIVDLESEGRLCR